MINIYIYIYIYIYEIEMLSRHFSRGPIQTELNYQERSFAGLLGNVCSCGEIVSCGRMCFFKVSNTRSFVES